MKTFKGFKKDMTCRDFQYEVGKEYETEKAVACETGFHACEYPLDCFNYYSPNDSVYCEVEQDGEISRHSNDSKIASTKIKIGAKLSIAEIVKAAINFTVSRTKSESKSNKDYGASSATGNCGASSATGYCCSAEANHPYAIAVAWGYKGRAKGVKGSRIVLADWVGNDDNYWTESEWKLKTSKMVKIDGKKYKENIWYTMRDGKIVEWEG